MRFSSLLPLVLIAGCGPETRPNEPAMAEQPTTAEREKCSNAAPEYDYRKCLIEEAAKSRTRMRTALARNRREAVEKDAEWEEIRRDTKFGRPLDPTYLEALNTSQAAWEEYVAAQCTLEGYTALGGTAEPAYEYMCRDRLNLQRLKELRSPFMIEAQRLEPVPEE